jgi:hypothetical protein
MRSIGRAAAIVAAVACLGVGAARAADDNEQECDDIMSELNKLATRQMNIPPPKGIGPVCAASGQLLGILKASRETAAQCYEDGAKLDRILDAFDKGIKDIEGQIEQGCK